MSSKGSAGSISVSSRLIASHSLTHRSAATPLSLSCHRRGLSSNSSRAGSATSLTKVRAASAARCVGQPRRLGGYGKSAAPTAPEQVINRIGLNRFAASCDLGIVSSIPRRSLAATARCLPWPDNTAARRCAGAMWRCPSRTGVVHEPASSSVDRGYANP
jgi:hypothetical protein